MGKHILLILSAGIAAYKCLELIRRAKDQGYRVTCVTTPAAEAFVTPLSLAAISGEPVHQDLFDRRSEAEIGHIKLARQADLVVVAPATADILAKMATGQADNLATTVLLATDRPVLVAPAMNPVMWSHPATQANMALLESRGIQRIGPNSGAMAENESGTGRMAEPAEILAGINLLLAGEMLESAAADLTAGEEISAPEGPSLKGLRALVTSGPTREPIDPVRYISNHSSGKQGHAIAAALAARGADVVLVSGPVSIPAPAGVSLVPVESARDMLAACQDALPRDIVVCAAAVADWRVASEGAQKMKKQAGEGPPALVLTENPDILATLSQMQDSRPALVVGFAAETENVVRHAISKRLRKQCDWLLANDVSSASGTFGGDQNSIHHITEAGITDWPRMTKTQVAEKLALEIAVHFEAASTGQVGARPDG